MSIRKLTLLISISFASSVAQGQSKDSLEVIAATKSFIKAFTEFDWKTFRNSFSTDATIFFPDWEDARRRTGKKEIEQTWLEAFPEFIDSTKKFDLKIKPRNLSMQLYDSTAIVTFHLAEDANYLSRRTLVFIKEKGGWKIVHLHASNLSRGK